MSPFLQVLPQLHPKVLASPALHLYCCTQKQTHTDTQASHTGQCGQTVQP